MLYMSVYVYAGWYGGSGEKRYIYKVVAGVLYAFQVSNYENICSLR